MGHSNDKMCFAVDFVYVYLEEDDVFVGKGATSEEGKYLFRAANVWGGDVRSIFLLPLVARCLETIYVYIWRMFVFISVVVTVWGSVGIFVV